MAGGLLDDILDPWADMGASTSSLMAPFANATLGRGKVMSGNYLGDFSGTETVVCIFSSYDVNGASVTLSGSPSFTVNDIKIYKSNSVTERASSSGITLIDTDGIDIDGRTGIHGFTINLTDNTDPGFYSTGTDFYAVVQDITVDGQIASFIAGRWSINNRSSSLVRYGLDHLIAAAVTGTDVIDNSIIAKILSPSVTADFDNFDNTTDSLPALADSVNSINIAGGGAFNFEATSDNTSGAIKSVTFVGSQTGTFANTSALDSSVHQITHTGNAIDIVYRVPVGGGRTGSAIVWNGRLVSSNDVITIQAYDFVGAAWNTRATITGTNGSVNQTERIILLSKNTGTSGSDRGIVLVRFVCTAQTAPVLFTDLLVVEAVNIGQSVGYLDGAIWVDTVNGTAGAERYVNGVADLPTLTWASALTLSGLTNLKRFDIAAGSSITFTANSSNYSINALQATVALGGQNITNTRIKGASISGIASGENWDFDMCSIGTVTLDSGSMERCAFTSTVTLLTGGEYVFDNCHSAIAGLSSPAFNFNSLGNTSVSVRHYSGGLEIRNMAAGDTMSIEGLGAVTINANCTGGTIAIRGTFSVTDNAAGAVSAFLTTPVADQVHSGTALAATGNTITLAAAASAVDGQYDPGRVLIISGTGAGQSRRILDYDGTTKVAVISRDWRINPDTTSSYVIFSSTELDSVNEGQLQGGSSTTATLNAFASGTDDIYVGQTLALQGGTGSDQARIITDYVGSTKIATVHRAWDITPDATSSYQILPTPTIGDVIVSNSTAIGNTGYQDGAVWVDTNNGTSGTTVGTNGVATLPVSTWANALSVASALSLQKFQVATGSSITLTASSVDYDINAYNSTLALGSQDVSGAIIKGAVVSGTGTVADTVFYQCQMGSTTLSTSVGNKCTLIECGISGDITLAAGVSNYYHFQKCYQNKSGSFPFTLNFDSTTATQVRMVDFSGAVSVNNMINSNFLFIDGDAQVWIEANCTDGVIFTRGNVQIIDFSGGAIAISALSPVSDFVFHGGVTAGTANSVTLGGGASSVSGAYAPGEVRIVSGTGAGQSRRIVQYNGSTKVATVARDWNTVPDTTSSYVLVMDASNDSVAEGLAQAGASTTITLSTNASAIDDTYIGQTIHLLSGTGSGQARIITDYVGSTRVATVDSAWVTTPGSTSAYRITPSPTVGDNLIALPSNASIADAVWDEVLTGASHNISSSAGRRLRTLQSSYDLGAVWIDTINGTAGTTAFENGVTNLPVDSLADATTIAAAVGLSSYQILSGSSITLAQTYANDVFRGANWTLSLGGQDVSNTQFWGAFQGVSGTCTGTRAYFFESAILSITTIPAAFVECGLVGPIVLSSAGTYNFLNCNSTLSEASAPIVDFNGASTALVTFRNYSGSVEFQNMQAGETVSIQGNGTITADSSCTGGTITAHGIFKIIDNSSGAVTFDLTSPVVNQIHQGVLQSATSNTATLEAGASAIDGTYDPGHIQIVTGTGAGQARNIIGYNGTTKVAVLGRAWRTVPDSTSSYVITSNVADMTVNEGLAQGGSSTTVTLNALASATDGVYVGQTVFLVGGVGSDQARIVTAYNGTTKVATVHRTWDITPDSTTSYFIMPNSGGGDLGVDTLSTVEALNDVSLSEILNTQMTESYAADGVAPTLTQALMLIQQKLGDFSITGSTITIRKLDGSSTAATYTLDDDTSPTASTRST